MIFAIGAAGGLVWILSSEKAAGANVTEPLPEP
jgi:hypothetical protein